MKSTKQTISLIYKSLIVIISFVALYLNFKFIKFKTAILYFTYLSNLAGFLYFLILVIRILMNKNEGKYHYVFKSLVNINLTLTMVLYNLILAKNNPVYVGYELECYLVHLVVPLLVIFDYFIFDKKGCLKSNYQIVWTVSLIVYATFVLTYSFLGGKFIDGASVPYVFMDKSIYGTSGVIINYVLILVLYSISCLLIRLFDNFLGKKCNIK